MYFEKFPYMIYTLDDYASGQIVTDIFRLVAIAQETKSNYTSFDEYDIKDGETPEILADKLYGNPMLHWVILLCNDILDPRFEWPLSNYDLIQYCKDKYHSVRSKNISLSSSTVSSNDPAVIRFITTLEVNDSIEISGASNSVNNGINSTISSIAANKTSFNISGASFTAESSLTYIKLFSDHLGKTHHYEDGNGNQVYEAGALITSISNYTYEERLNEDKRRIKILKPDFISTIEQELEIKIKP